MAGSSRPDPRSGLAMEGEELARKHLVEEGFRILSVRDRTRWGEIDLVAEDEGTIVFVEVKTRRSGRHGSPEESVTPAKQRRLARLAAGYLARKELEGRPCRFDVVAVELPVSGRPTLRHLKDAFRI